MYLLERHKDRDLLFPGSLPKYPQQLGLGQESGILSRLEHAKHEAHHLLPRCWVRRSVVRMLTSLCDEATDSEIHCITTRIPDFPVLCSPSISLFRFAVFLWLVGSVSVGCMFSGMRHVASRRCWCIIVHSSCYDLLYFCSISCNVSFFFISDLSSCFSFAYLSEKIIFINFFSYFSNLLHLFFLWPFKSPSFCWVWTCFLFVCFPEV